MMKVYLLPLILLFTLPAFSQIVVIDSCFNSLTPSTSFTGGTNLRGQDADLLQWNGSSW